MSSPAARRRKQARDLMIEDSKPKQNSYNPTQKIHIPNWYIECIKCKKLIYQLHKIRCDQTMKGHTTVVIDGFDKWVAPHDFNTMGIYDKVDVCWTCFDCN